MQELGRDGIAILPTSMEQVRNRDVNYPFRADSDFAYLTNFWEPEAVLVLVPGRKHGEYILFCREEDEQHEIWHGRRAGQAGAIEIFGADDSFPVSDIDEILPGLLENKHRVFYNMGVHADFDQRLLGWIHQLKQKGRAGVSAPGEFVALDHYLQEMRLFKSAFEIKMMKKAAQASVSAHQRAMQSCRPGLYEYHIEAELMHEFMQFGCRAEAYPSIVGGGENGCILHYTENNAVLKNGDLLLIDAGAEYQGYAADITRTFPVNGRFSPQQKALYEVVLEAQLAAIDAVKPGNSWDAPHSAAVRKLTRGLIKLGLLKGRVDKLIRDEAYKPFYMHRTGHWLGLDVHDVGDYKVDNHWRILEPGMVLTVEPGLYIAKNPQVDKQWWDIGIRIEDDVRVTRTGHEVLTARAPKTVEEIETIMQSSRTASESLEPPVRIKKSAAKQAEPAIGTRRSVVKKTRAKKSSDKDTRQANKAQAKKAAGRADKKRKT